MTEEKKNINLGFRATASRQEELKIAGARRKQSVQEMLEEGLGLLLEGRETAAKPHALPLVAVKPINARWHAMLDEILADKEERIGIEKNLQWAVDSIRKKGGVKRKPLSIS